MKKEICKHLPSNFPKVIAVDFDGTLFTSDYPKILEPNLPLIRKCIELQSKGYIINLWTCRKGKELRMAVRACEEQGLVFNYINKNEKTRIKYYGDSRKLGADYYLDDKAISFESFLEL